VKVGLVRNASKAAHRRVGSSESGGTVRVCAEEVVRRRRPWPVVLVRIEKTKQNW
jgi:hypothetical protein